MRRLLAAAALAACYAPAPPSGAPCNDGVCPTGLVCSPATRTCETTSTGRDGGGDAIDAPDAMTAPFKYRRRVTIANTSTAVLGTGYTIRVPLGATLQQLIDANKVRADHADLRVMRDGAMDERNRIVDTSPAPVAINFSVAQPIPAGATDTSYYVYYGRPNASAPPANGSQVFALYDGFATALSSMWLTNNAPSVVNGKLLLGAGRADAITTNAGSDGVPVVSAMELVAAISNPQANPTQTPEGTFWYWFGFQRTGDFAATNPWTIWIARGQGVVRAEQLTPGGCEGLCIGNNATQNTAEHYYTIERDSNATRFYLDGNLSFTATVNNTADYSLMVRNFMQNGDVTVDWIRARTRVTPEPAITLGPEEML
jgi:hypothetical protein